MAKHYRAQCTVYTDSVSPRDGVQINPCFRDEGLTTDPDQLATDLTAVIAAAAPASCQITVKMYELPGVKPNYPKGQHTINTGQAAASATVRELALCLSFYGGQNVPRRRGRLYMPVHWWKTGSAASLGNRPTTQDRSSASYLVNGFTGLGGVDVDWILWSEADQAAHAVTNWYVDDEWDVVRSRGLRPTSRTSGTTTESVTFETPLFAVPSGAGPSDALE